MSVVLKIIMGEESYESGLVKVSGNIKIAYMSQIIFFEDENATTLETLRNATQFTEEKVRSILAGFRFKAPDVLKKVGSLSGGERSRLKLCLLMQNQVNFLILDEPTNHLDIESREWIEDAVADFNGTMLFISHDRFFLNRFASKVWNMKDGEITEYVGSFEDYQQANTTDTALKTTPTTNKKKQKLPAKVKEKPKPLVSFEALIYETEAELSAVNKEIDLRLADSEYGIMSALYNKKHQLEEKIASLYDEWANEGENGGYDNA